jgi:hypothetical protein
VFAKTAAATHAPAVVGILAVFAVVPAVTYAPLPLLLIAF